MRKAYFYLVVDLDTEELIRTFAFEEHGLAAKEMAETEARHLSDEKRGSRYGVAGVYAIFSKSTFSFEAPEP